MLPITITDHFQINGSVISAEPFGNGLINDTYRITMSCIAGGATESFVLQRINHRIFTDPISLMRNVERVCAHIQAKLLLEGVDEAQRRSLILVPTRTGAHLYHAPAENNAPESYWRCFHFIDECTSYDVVDTPELAYQAARQFGEFQRLVSDLNGARLAETIPDFHHTPRRLLALQSAVKNDPHRRAASCAPEIRFALDHESIARKLLNLHQSGLIPERITHNDTKISNVLICNRSQEGICVVDLDTVMPGLSLYDFGDLMRTCVSPAPEDTIDLDAIECRVPMFEAIAVGFLDAMNDVLTPAERENLAFSGKLITYELGLRFLTDHLLGDTYFHPKYPGHNLDRARSQFELVRKIQAREPDMVIQF
jgi:hypothetical protein